MPADSIDDLVRALRRGEEVRLGSYCLLEPLGEGGMGVVFKALHVLMDRLVAVKVIRPELLSRPDAARRFRREIRAAAQLSHPNVVAALDAEEVGGLHFLVMEYCDGVDLGALVRARGPLPVGLACEYVRQAALGLQHAHERGLVHRDVKPENLLLAGAVVKVLDLGLARLRDPGGAAATSLTEVGAVGGTPDYMAPEQALDMRAADVRSDIYSLGCTLYYLLAGRVPFPDGSALEKLLQRQLQEPVPLEQVRPEVPEGLLGVVRRMMARRPEDRYQAPAEAAAVLQPFARADVPAGWEAPGAAEPAEAPTASGPRTGGAPPWPAAARPAAGSPRGRPTAADLPTTMAESPRTPRRRRPLIAGLAGAAVIGLVLIGVGLGLFGPRNRQSGTRADSAAQGRGETGPAGPREAVGPANGPVRALRAFAELPAVGDTEVHALAFSGDGKHLAAGCAFRGDANSPNPRGEVRVWDVARREEVFRSPGLPQPVWCVAAGPEPGVVAAGTGDWDRPLPGVLQLWDWRGRKLVREPDLFPDGVLAVAVHPKRKRTAAVGLRDRTAWLMDLDRGSRVALEGHRGKVNAAAFSRDGALLATAGEDRTVRLWDGNSGKPLGEPEGPAGAWLSGVAVAPGGEFVVAGTGVVPGGQAEVWVWDARTRKRVARLERGNADVFCVAFAPDGKTFFAGFQSGEGCLWEVGSWRLAATLQHGGAIWGAAYAPTERLLATAGGWERPVRLWRLDD